MTEHDFLKIELPIKPLSVNKAFQGKHFRTKECKIYEKTLKYLLPSKKIKADYYKIAYTFYLKNFGNTDCDNLVKVLQDCMVKKGIISDDRRIVCYFIGKIPAKKDSIKIEISKSDLNFDKMLEQIKK